MSEVKIVGDGEGLVKALSELKGFIEVGNLPLEVIDRLVGFLNFSEELSFVQTDLFTTGAGELVVLFNPSNRLFRLLAAFRTGNIESFLIQNGITH